MLALEERQLLSTFTVANTLGDGSDGSLRWAVAQANSNAGADTIDFEAGVFSTPRTITLTGTQLELTDQSGATTIEGPAGGVTVSGGGLSRVFQVDSGVAAAISGMTITGGAAGYYYGGGLYSLGSTALTNCTVSGNSAWYTGGGVASGSYFNRGGSLSLTNCTISGNYGGNAFTYFGGPITATNTIIAGTGGGLLGRLDPASSNNVIGGDPLLAPLGLYGGTSLTMPLLPGSPAIDAGTDAGAPATDQRGEPRFGGVDVGAFESQGFTFTVVPGGTPQSADIGTAFANPLAVAVTANSAIEPVDGGIVGFVAHPAPNGATAILSSSSAVIAAGGVAVDAMPNNALGSYTMDASVAGSSASFSLTNTGTVFTSLVVNTTSDAMAPGVGLLSLREAIAFDNTSPTGNLPITFDKHVFGKAQVITLTGSQLELSNPNGAISITGPKKGVTIDGGGLSRVFQVDAGVVASISGATITGGDAGSSYYGGADGGGLLNYGTLTLQDCTVTGNINAGSGGGLFNNGTATLINSTISGNSALSGSGGGLFNYGTATLINSTISGNSASYNGGGLLNYGTATLINSTLSDNSAYRGGGLFNGGEATLTTCTVSGNTASYGGGGVATKSNAPYAYATTTLTNSTVSGNSTPYGVGGGLSNEGTTTLTGCTVSGNSARVGGGLFSSSNPNVFGDVLVGSSVSLTNCTVIGNSATEKGGGVYTGGPIWYFPNSGHAYGSDALTNLINCTVSGNSTAGAGGGLATGRLGTTTATNTTIRGNSAADGGGVSTEGLVFYSSTFYGATNLNRCTVSGNTATGNGGGIDNGDLGTTTVNQSNVFNNSADAGGGIANSGSLSVASSMISNNKATSQGGGLSTTGGSVDLTSTLISGNRVDSLGTALGGGIASEDTILSLAQCIILANQAKGQTAYGGGIYALNSTVSIKNSLVLGNVADGSQISDGGGIYSWGGTLDLSWTSVFGNRAGRNRADVFRKA